MPRVSPHYVPKYQHHRKSGQARVEIHGKTFYLGPYKSKASYLEYDRIVNEWLANGRRLPQPAEAQEITVVEVIAAYKRFAQTYYQRQHSGRHEADRVKEAVRPLQSLYGRTPAAEFGPKNLKAVRQNMINAGLCRTQINARIGRIKRMFKWAVSEELLPPAVHQALATVEGLRRGRTTARESQPVALVDRETVNATVEHVPQTVADMVAFQRLTGCRPGEACNLRPGDIDRTGEVWLYAPSTHKTEHHGRGRKVFIGPKAQEVLKPYLLRPDDQYCFCPRESERRRRELAHEARKTPLCCGNKPGSNQRKTPKRSPGRCYTNDSYRRAIHRGVDKANKERETWNQAHPKQTVPLIEKWAPNRLRHLAGTELRQRYGLEAAQVILGHAQADVTQIYAERDEAKARDVMREVG